MLKLYLAMKNDKPAFTFWHDNLEQAKVDLKEDYPDEEYTVVELLHIERNQHMPKEHTYVVEKKGLSFDSAYAQLQKLIRFFESPQNKSERFDLSIIMKGGS